ncbi:MAG TPA: glycosyltransferase family 4 protein [Kiloniellales bacterium]
MKICEICAVDYTMYQLLRPLLRKLRDAGHEVVGVCADGPMLDPMRAEGFRIECIPSVRRLSPIAHVRAFLALRRIFRRERFDIVHAHTPIVSLVARLAAAATGVPKVAYTAHGFYFHEHMPYAVRRLFIAAEWLAGRCTDILMTQSAEDAESARRYRLCRGAIETIGNGVDLRAFQPPAEIGARSRSNLRRELGAGPADRVVVTIGRLVKEKGFRELFQAMRQVDAKLWVIGERLPSEYSGALAPMLRDIADDPDLGARVSLLGRRDDVPALLSAADVFVLPSYREGMPRSIIEAMASGLPVVATNIRGCREEVIDGETGFLVPIKDAHALAAALNRLVGDPALRQDMGQAGRMRAQVLFDETHVLDRQLDILGLTPRQTETRKVI